MRRHATFLTALLAAAFGWSCRKTTLPTELPTTLLTPILTVAEAILQCTAQGLIDNPLDNNDAFDQCVDNLTGG